MRCCVRFLLFLVSLLYLLLGLALVVAGSGAGAEVFSPWTDDELQIFMVVVLVVGGVLFLCGLLGLITSCCKSYNLAYFFSFLIFFIIIFQIIGAILFFFFRFEFEQILVKTLKQTMSSYSSPEMRETPYQSSVGVLWDQIQLNLSCCGVEAFTDWSETPFGSTQVPPSCCVDPQVASCGQNVDYSGGDNPSIHEGGCIGYLGEGIHTHLALLAGLLAAGVVLQVLAVCFSCCLARSVQVDYQYMG